MDVVKIRSSLVMNLLVKTVGILSVFRSCRITFLLIATLVLVSGVEGPPCNWEGIGRVGRLCRLQTLSASIVTRNLSNVPASSTAVSKLLVESHRNRQKFFDRQVKIPLLKYEPS